MWVRALLLFVLPCFGLLSQELQYAFHSAKTLADKKKVLESLQRSNGAVNEKERMELEQQLRGMIEAVSLLEQEEGGAPKQYNAPASSVTEAKSAPRVVYPAEGGPVVTRSEHKDSEGSEAPPLSDAVTADEKLDYITKSLRDASKGLDFLPAFISSISMILVSEIGDKTFFIAAIMAMRHNRMLIFAAAISALILMTVLSAVIGVTLPALLPRRYTHYAATALFFFFGIRLLKDAQGMHAGASDELEEVESEIASKKNDDAATTLESGERGPPAARPRQHLCLSPIFIQCFTLTFLAEWGDRSQITTIALAAAKDPFGVTLGGIIGHACCTGVAVVGGKILAARISERTVAIVGGVLFLVFALHSVWVGPEGDK